MTVSISGAIDFLQDKYALSPALQGLVISSIMIGVITYISVLERKKEIGILRGRRAKSSTRPRLLRLLAN